MFITRATRHDKGDVAEFLESQGWSGASLARGAAFFARDGVVVGCLRVVEVEPQTVVLDDVVVERARRRQGIGSSLVKAAMNSRGGTLYARCEPPYRRFFERFGFEEVAEDDVPPSVAGELGSATRAGLYLRAR
jgi:N-acetylglutamate synthase-like GNAT family acetyltransferase